MNAAEQSLIDTAGAKLLADVWKHGVGYSLSIAQQHGGLLADGLIRGWGGFNQLELELKQPFDLSIDYGTPDWLAATMMEANLFHFSAGKTLDLVNQLNAEVPKNKTFAEFKKNAGPLVDTYNKNHLRTEYNFAYTTGQVAAEYHRMVDEVDLFPNWQYLTVNDGRVRPEHQKLHGKVFKWNDPVWATLYPPNGWGCRCYVKNIRGGRVSEGKAAIKALQETIVDSNGNSAYDLMKKRGMDINRADLGVVFRANQAYIGRNHVAKLGVEDNGVKPFEDINQARLDDLAVQERDAEFARNWYDQNAKDRPLVDYAGRPVTFPEQALENNLKPRHLKEGRQSLLEHLPDVLAKPDEVYLQQRSKDVYQYAYLRFYKGVNYWVTAEVDRAKGFNIKSWLDLTKDVDQRRSGVLVKNNN